MEFPIYRFKYFPNADYVSDFISKGTLQFSNPFVDFNDPFDCLPHVYMGGFDRFVREARKRGVREKKGVMRTRFDTVRRQIMNGEFYKVAPPFGVCCLSRDPRNLLMWAHYAKDHKGMLAVIKFDGLMSIEDETVFPIPVDYSDERPSLSIWNGPQEMEKWNLTKGRCWEYEQEDRMLLMRYPPNIYQFDRKQHLEAIVLGARSAPEFRSL